MMDNIEYGRKRLKDSVQKRGKGRRDRRRREKIWERQTYIYWYIFQSSQTAYQSANWVLAKGNINSKGNHDLMSSMEEVCKVSCYNRPRGFWWFSYIRIILIKTASR